MKERIEIKKELDLIMQGLTGVQNINDKKKKVLGLDYVRVDSLNDFVIALFAGVDIVEYSHCDCFLRREDNYTQDSLLENGTKLVVARDCSGAYNAGGRWYETDDRLFLLNSSDKGVGLNLDITNMSKEELVDEVVRSYKIKAYRHLVKGIRESDVEKIIGRPKDRDSIKEFLERCEYEKAQILKDADGCYSSRFGQLIHKDVKASLFDVIEKVDSIITPIKKYFHPIGGLRSGIQSKLFD